MGWQMSQFVEFVAEGQPVADDGSSEAKVRWQNVVGRAARDAVAAAEAAQIAPDIPVDVVIYWFRHGGLLDQPDLDNIVKPILDALAVAKRNQRFAGGEVFQDDCQVISLRAVRVSLDSLPDYGDLPEPVTDMLEGSQSITPEEFVYIRITAPATAFETLELA